MLLFHKASLALKVSTQLVIEKVPERYRKRIEINSDGCWIWTGSRDKKGGYGFATFCDRTVLAHRMVFELLIGPLPNGFHLHHKCEVRCCVNPDHLVVLSKIDHRREHTSARTVCKNGHELTPENTYFYNSGNSRACRICRSAADRRRKERKSWQTKHLQ